MHGGARRHGRRRPRPPLCLWQHRGALPDQDPGLQGQRHPGRRPPFSTHTTKVGQGTGGRLRRRSSHQDSALIENGCDRGSRGPRASADGIRMYTGPVSWVSKSNQCCEGCYSRVVCIFTIEGFADQSAFLVRVTATPSAPCETVCDASPPPHSLRPARRHGDDRSSLQRGVDESFNLLVHQASRCQT